MPISKKQRQILAFPFTSYDALIADGAVRSGKTSFMSIAFVDDAMRRYDRQRFPALCPSVSSYGFQRMGLGFFYRFKQRSGFRLHLLSSHFGFPDYCGSHAADSFGY